MISSGFFNCGKRLVSHWEQENFSARLLSHDMVYESMTYVDDIPVSSSNQDVPIVGRRFDGHRGKADDITLRTGYLGVIRTLAVYHNNTGKLMCALALPVTTVSTAAVLTIKWAKEGIFTFDDHDLVEDVATWFPVSISTMGLRPNGEAPSLQDGRTGFDSPQVHG